MNRKPEEPERTPNQRREAWAADRDLVRRARAGDPDAQDALVRRLSCVPRFLRRLDGRGGRPLGRDRLDDLVQDVLLILWRKLDGYEGRSTLETWAFRVCKLELWNARRRAAREEERSSTEDDTAPDAVPVEPDGEPAVDEERLERALEALGEPAASVLRLKHFESCTFEEIGERMEVSPNTAKTWYYRGLRRLRAALEDAEKERQE